MVGQGEISILVEKSKGHFTEEDGVEELPVLLKVI